MTHPKEIWIDTLLVKERIDGWTIESDDGSVVARNSDRTGFVAFNDDMSGLYIADVSEVPFAVIDALRKRQPK